MIKIALATLPPLQQMLATDHFLKGVSVHILSSRYNLKRVEVESIIATALASMRTALRCRGVWGVADVI